MAAAVSLWDGKSIREVDVKRVQAALRRQGVSISKAELLERERMDNDDMKQDHGRLLSRL